ncbi:hypothetical protein CLV63_10394 [Murinocardiopsis flavida]|uniref:DUF4352 domain-containing protein n=1 Tax=Murinocardiopsis flavida TaxID=645275 RepID=A0A2P8DQ97_9ACTN|nr:hypothetical protein [Murinocardiopsis flavida]PSK99371.1 hypothetical protein CLV63_10394 [Murinocardiopsis flavida]
MARRSFLSTAGTVAMSLVLVALLITAHSYFITPEQETAPIAHTGARGDVVDAGRFTMKVGKVRLAESVAEESFGGPELQKAKGVWVVVEAAVEPTLSPMQAGTPTLTNGDDFEFLAGTQLTTTIDQSSVPFEPGIPRRGFLVFEIPTKRLTPPLTLRMHMTDNGLDDRLAAEAQIDLGLDAGDIEALRAKAAPKVTISEPGYA